MKLLAPYFVLLGASLFSVACSSEQDVDCAVERENGHPIAIEFEDGDSCDYEGSLVDDATGESSSLDCSIMDGVCACRGGDDFDTTYSITVVDKQADETLLGVIEVQIVGTPICVNRKTIERFEPIGGMGGAGGAGGSATAGDDE